LKHKPGEILIKFMTEHIRRFVDSPQQLTQESFKKLFGSSEFKDKLKGLAEKDREDALVTAYSERVKQVGAFGYTSSALVLHPGKDRTQFHLIYATRDPKGIEVFKSAEKKAMAVMEKARGEAHKREREERVGHSQLGLSFDNGTTQDPSAYFVSLRDRYTSRAKAEVLSLIQTKTRLTYDEAWSSAMTFPLTWKSDLKNWIHEWEQAGRLETTGMKERQRIPRLGQNIFLVWKGARTSSSRGQPD
jgi:hypothetical protein